MLKKGLCQLSGVIGMPLAGESIRRGGGTLSTRRSVTKTSGNLQTSTHPAPRRPCVFQNPIFRGSSEVEILR